ncbi:MAG: hypothetical protein WDW36_004263 [Sanguina aurantia]
MQYPALPEDYPAEEEAATEAEDSERLPHTELNVLKGHEGAVLVVRFNSTGTYCLSGGKDRIVRLWNPHKGLLVKSYAGHGYDVRGVTVSQDNSKFASCGVDKQVFLWDVASGRFIRKFRGHDSTVNAVTYASKDDALLVTAGYDQCIRAWDCRSRSLDAVQTLKAFKDSVTAVATAGWEVIGSSVDGTVRRFDVRMGRAYTDDLHHPITSCALTHDSLCVLTACLDSSLRLLDKKSGELLASYTGHVHGSVQMDCCLTPSDAHVVGSSETGEVLYWDLVESRLVRRFSAHAGVVCSMAMHPEGRCLVTASVDGLIKVWE